MIKFGYATSVEKNVGSDHEFLYDFRCTDYRNTEEECSGRKICATPKKAKGKNSSLIYSGAKIDLWMLFDRDLLKFRKYAESCPLDLLNESGEIFLEEAVDFVKLLMDGGLQVLKLQSLCIRRRIEG